LRCRMIILEDEDQLDEFVLPKKRQADGVGVIG
jgi:hypothetical protein